MDEHLGPVSSPPVGSWPGLQLQAYVSSRAESLTSDQKADHYSPPNIIVLVLLCWSLLGCRFWVRLMAFFPAAYIKLPGPVKASQQGGRTNWISVIQVCSIFRKQDLTIPFWWMTKINSLYCFRVLPKYPWLEKNKAKKKNWGRYFTPVTRAFVNLRFLGGVLFSVGDNPN